jgi:hypothetical protein
VQHERRLLPEQPRRVDAERQIVAQRGPYCRRRGASFSS